MVVDEDTTISRYHSKITLEKGNIYLSDNQSKFGTLILIRKPINLCSKLSGIVLQFSGTVAKLICNRKSDNSIPTE